MAVGGGVAAETAGLTASKYLHSQQLAATYSPESARQVIFNLYKAAVELSVLIAYQNLHLRF